jgi:hypothetical protein
VPNANQPCLRAKAIAGFHIGAKLTIGGWPHPLPLQHPKGVYIALDLQEIFLKKK